MNSQNGRPPINKNVIVAAQGEVIYNVNFTRPRQICLN
jgi:hypothetical protein